MLKYRLITGISIGAFFAGMILFAPVWLLLALLVPVYFLAQLEYCEMCKAKGYELERIGIFVCGFLFLGATVWETGVLCNVSLDWNYPPTVILLYLTPAFLVIQSILRRKTEKAAECLGLSLFGIWYVAVLLSFMVRLVLELNDPIFNMPGGYHLLSLEESRAVGGCAPKVVTTTGRLLLIFFILLVKMSDIGAYTFGMLWGDKIKRRLVPEISPKKSIPGLVGAYVGSLLTAFVVAWLVRVFSDPTVTLYSLGDSQGNIIGGGITEKFCITFGDAAILGVLMATVGVLGDLAESLLKRSFGVKDSSSRFPGMGGFLDILDSLLLAAPFMYFFVVWFLR